MVAEVHVVLLPLVEVLLCADSAADPLLCPHRPVLHKGARPLDGRLVDTLAGVDGESSLAVNGEVALLGPWFVWCQLGVAIEDIVL